MQEGISDVVFLNLEFDDGVAVHIHVSWLDSGKVRRMTVVGSRKMVVYDDVSTEAKIQLFDKGIDRENVGDSLGEFDSFGKFQLTQRAGDVLIPKLDFGEPLRLECAHFVDCISQGKIPVVDGQNNCGLFACWRPRHAQRARRGRSEGGCRQIAKEGEG